jgi:hypothetical protein
MCYDNRDRGFLYFRLYRFRNNYRFNFRGIGVKNIVILKDLVDRIGRKYSKDELMTQLKDEYIGELGIGEGLDVDLVRASHKIFNLRFEENSLIGDVKFLQTPFGNILKTLYEQGFNLRTCLRGTGIIDKDLNVANYNLITIDLENSL